tara:strand:+ start:305 stop:523 length:219 start_codon:yes stop_codon:yes gene_type:complete
MSEKENKRLETGSWCEVKTNLRETELLKIVGYRGEMLHCIDDEGRMMMVKPNSAKVSRIFQVKPDGKIIEGL